MTYEEAKKQIVGKRVVVYKSGGKVPLLKGVEVSGIVPPISEKSTTWGLEYGAGNKFGGITPDDTIQIVG